MSQLVLVVKYLGVFHFTEAAHAVPSHVPPLLFTAISHTDRIYMHDTCTRTNIDWPLLGKAKLILEIVTFSPETVTRTRQNSRLSP